MNWPSERARTQQRHALFDQNCSLSAAQRGTTALDNAGSPRPAASDGVQRRMRGRRDTSDKQTVPGFEHHGEWITYTGATMVESGQSVVNAGTVFAMVDQNWTIWATRCSILAICCPTSSNLVRVWAKALLPEQGFDNSWTTFRQLLRTRDGRRGRRGVTCGRARRATCPQLSGNSLCHSRPLKGAVVTSQGHILFVPPQRGNLRVLWYAV